MTETEGKDERKGKDLPWKIQDRVKQRQREGGKKKKREKKTVVLFWVRVLP